MHLLGPPDKTDMQRAGTPGKHALPVWLSPPPGEITGMADDQLPSPDNLADEQGRPVHPCIQCRTPVVYPAQPGSAICGACGVSQYLTAPSAIWPTGGLGLRSRPDR